MFNFWTIFWMGATLVSVTLTAFSIMSFLYSKETRKSYLGIIQIYMFFACFGISIFHMISTLSGIPFP